MPKLHQLVTPIDHFQLYEVSAIDNELQQIKVTRIVESALGEAWSDLMDQLSYNNILTPLQQDVKKLYDKIALQYGTSDWYKEKQESIWLPLESFNLSFKIYDSLT